MLHVQYTMYHTHVYTCTSTCMLISGIRGHKALQSGHVIQSHCRCLQHVEEARSINIATALIHVVSEAYKLLKAVRSGQLRGMKFRCTRMYLALSL